MRRIAFALAVVCLLAISAFGQTAEVAQTDLYFYDGSSNLEYVCTARASQPVATLAISQIVDSSNTATVTTAADHGLSVGNKVVIAGVTGDTDLNGTYVVASVGSTTTFTYTSANVTDATYNNSGITATTTAPRTTAAIWSIQKFSYTGTTLIRKQWAVSPASSVAESTAPNICDNRTSLAYN